MTPWLQSDSNEQTENQSNFDSFLGQSQSSINLIPPLTGALLVGCSWSRRNYVTGKKESELRLGIAEWS